MGWDGYRGPFLVNCTVTESAEKRGVNDHIVAVSLSASRTLGGASSARARV